MVRMILTLVAGELRAEWRPGRRRVRPGPSPVSVVLGVATIGELEEAFASLAERLGPKRARIRVQLGRPWVRVRRLRDLPPVPQRHVRNLVTQQAAKFFDVADGGLVVDARRVTERSGGRVIFAAAASNELVQSLIDASVHLGWEVESISALGVPVPLDLRPDAMRTVSGRRSRVGVMRGLALVSGAWLFTAIGVGAHLISSQRAVDRELEELRPAMDALSELSGQVARAKAMLDATAGSRASFAQTLEPFAELVRGLPDSAVVTGLEVDDSGSVRVDLVARRALEAVASLETMVHGEVTLDGVPSREVVDGRTWERFAVRLKRGSRDER